MGFDLEDKNDTIVLDLNKRCIKGYARGKAGFKKQIERIREQFKGSLV